MKCLFLILFALIVLVSGQGFKDVVNNRVRARFSWCIQNHHDISLYRLLIRPEILKGVADLFAAKFSTFKRKFTFIEFENFLPILEQSEYYRSIKDPRYQAFLVAGIETAVQDCHEMLNYDDDVACTSSNHVMRRCDLPRFHQIEEPDMAVVLDFMLVNWQTPPRQMITTPYGLDTLRAFAEDALAALERAMNHFQDSSSFRDKIRQMWAKRASIFYNAKNTQYPYICHRYMMEERTPRTCGCAASMFSARYRTEVESQRNPPATSEEIAELMNIHVADRRHQDERDIFFDYETYGMSSSELYLEKQIDQFYRILFFILELNNYDSVGAMPEEVQKILWDDNAYSKYLRDLRKRLLEKFTDFKNAVRRSLEYTARPLEEDMVILSRIVNADSASSSTLSTTTSTTSSPIEKTTTMKPLKKGKSGTLYSVWCIKHKVYKPPSSSVQTCEYCDSGTEPDYYETDADNFNNQTMNACLRKLGVSSIDQAFLASTIKCSGFERNSPWDRPSPYESFDFKELDTIPFTGKHSRFFFEALNNIITASGYYGYIQ